MTPIATRLKLRLEERYSWFLNDWFFKWHHIGQQHDVEIDLFNGRTAHYMGIAFSGSAHNIFWSAIVRGVRKEVVEQLAWVEEAVRPYDRSVAERAIDECAGQIVSFARSLRRAAIKKDRILRGNGINFPVECDLGDWKGTDASTILAEADAIKQALFPVPLPPETKLLEEPLNQSTPHTYQVALSFAGEQRTYVRAVAEALAARHIAVFYDEFEAINLWGKDGAEYFHQIFAQDAQHVVMFISAEYIAKSWTRQERRAALSRQMESDTEYVLPVRFDSTPVPGFPTTLQYLEAGQHTPAELAVLIAEKIGLPPTAGKASDIPPLASRAMSGEVTFDYGAFNGRFLLGDGAAEFETKWSKSSDTNICLYNDPPSINGIAIAKDAATFDQITDASIYDFTSRTRRPKVGEIAVLRNTNGFYAAVQIERIEDDRRGAAADAVTLKYVIQPDGSAGFAVE